MPPAIFLYEIIPGEGQMDTRQMWKLSHCQGALIKLPFCGYGRVKKRGRRKRARSGNYWIRNGSLDSSRPQIRSSPWRWLGAGMQICPWLACMSLGLPFLLGVCEALAVHHPCGGRVAPSHEAWKVKPCSCLCSGINYMKCADEVNL